MSSLRVNKQLLGQLKEQLFKLWGDLEEKKSEMLRQQSKGKNVPPPSSLQSEFSPSSPVRRPGAMPDADSDSENESTHKISKALNTSVLTERDPNTSESAAGMLSHGEGAKFAPKNRAFTCCIRQYGVKVDEDDPSKADAGEDRRWQRMFGLFGTQIM